MVASKGAMPIQCPESLSTNGVVFATCNGMKRDTYRTLHMKVNSKWIKCPNLRIETKTQRENLCEFRLDSTFLDMRPKVQAKKEKNLDFIKDNTPVYQKTQQ